MNINKYLVIIFIFVLTVTINAQSSSTFTEITRNAEFGIARSVAIGKNNTIFLANGLGGLWVYKYENQTFTEITHINDGGYAYDVTVGQENTIFLANGEDGLRAYKLEGNSLVNTAHIDNGEKAFSITIRDDGVLFLANGGDGLRAYNYDGNSFYNIGHIKDIGCCVDRARGVAVGPDGTIFLACWDIGIRSYRFVNNTFTNTADRYDKNFCHKVAVAPNGMVYVVGWGKLQSYFYNGQNLALSATILTGIGGTHPQKDVDVAVGNAGTIFVANGTGGLVAYNHVQNDFIKLDQIIDGTGSNAYGIAIDKDSTIFLANGKDGLRAYNFENEVFTNIAHINNSGYATSVTVGKGGTIFLSNFGDGLRAYEFDGNSLVNTAHICNGGVALEAAIDSNGIAFLANGEDGLRAYSYSGTNFTNIAHVADIGYTHDISVNNNNTIFVATDNELRVYKYNGNSLSYITKVNVNVTDVETFSDSLVYTSNYSGLNIYKFIDDQLVEIASQHSYPSYSIELDSNGIIYMVASEIYDGHEEQFGGIYAYTFDGNSLVLLSSIESNYSEYYNELSLGPDGTILVVNVGRGLTVHKMDGNVIRNLGGFDTDGIEKSSAVGNDGTIFLADGDFGLIAYSFNNDYVGIDDESTNLDNEFYLNQNYPNPFNPITTINFSLPTETYVKISVFDLNGKLITFNSLNYLQSGTHYYEIDGSHWSTGIYIVQVEALDNKLSQKISLIK